MNVKYEKKPAMTFIGYHTEIRPEEGYQKCPEFWDKAFAVMDIPICSVATFAAIQEGYFIRTGKDIEVWK